MTATRAQTTPLDPHQRRIRQTTKRLVIELGYLEHCLAGGLQDANVQAAAAGIDTAIDMLNQHQEDFAAIQSAS